MKGDERSEAAGNVLEKVEGFDFGAATATAEEIVRNASAIAAKRGTAEEQQEVLREQLRAVPSDDDGLDQQTIGASRATLDHLPVQAEAVATAAARTRAEAAEAGAAERRVADLENELEDLDQRLDQREVARQGLDAMFADAGTKFADAQSLLRDTREAAAAAESLRAQADEKAHLAGLFQQEMAQLREGGLAQAERRATAAEKAYADAQRHDAAAAAAHGLHPGDDCSVCNRPLPAGWQPPVAEGLETARTDHQAAAAELTQVRDQSRDLATKAEMTSNQAGELQQGAEQSWETAMTAAADLASLLGSDGIDLATLPPADELLQRLSSAVDRAREDLAAYDAASQQLRERRAALHASLTGARDTRDKSQAARRRNAEDAETAVGTFRTSLTSLPDELRFDVVLPDDPVAIENIPLTGLAAAYQALDDRAEELDHRSERRGQLQEQLDRLAEHVRDLDRRWTDQVLTPGNKLVATINTHRDVLSDGTGCSTCATSSWRLPRHSTTLPD